MIKYLISIVFFTEILILSILNMDPELQDKDEMFPFNSDENTTIPTTPSYEQEEEEKEKLDGEHLI